MLRKNDRTKLNALSAPMPGRRAVTQWSRENARLEIKGSLARITLEALCGVLGQDTVSPALIVLVQPRKHPGITEKLMTGT